MAGLAEAPPARERPDRRAGSSSRGDRLSQTIATVERHWRWALAILLGLDALLLLYMGRGTTFFYDDWDFVTHDYGGGLHSLLAAHVGNISVFPVAVYKILFHLVGLDHYAVFRLVVVVLHLIAACLVFALCSRRVEPAPALLATALILFLGAAWEDLLWAFQVGYLLSVVGGLAAWLLIERRDRAGDLLAALALVVSMGSSSLGIPLVVGVAVELAWQRDWQRLWVVAVPAALYLLWYLGYGESQVTSNSLINAPGFAADLAAAAAGALVGRALEWGRPLILLLTLAVVWRLVMRRAPVSPRLVGLLATAVALWVVIATARSTISPPETSRYVYLGAIAIVLIGVEMLRGVALPARVTLVASAFIAFFALTGLTVMHTGASGLRSTSTTLVAELGAMEIGSAYVSPGFQPDPSRAPQITAGPYLHTVRAIGSSPGDTVTEIAASDSGSRAAADAVLVALGLPRLTVSSRRPDALAPAPAVDGVVSATVAQRGACEELTPMPGTTLVGSITFPPGGGTIGDRGRLPVGIAVKRFGDTYHPSPVSIAAHSEIEVAQATDAAAANVPWQVQVTSASPVLACGLRP